MLFNNFYIFIKNVFLTKTMFYLLYYFNKNDILFIIYSDLFIILF